MINGSKCIYVNLPTLEYKEKPLDRIMTGNNPLFTPKPVLMLSVKKVAQTCTMCSSLAFFPTWQFQTVWHKALLYNLLCYSLNLKHLFPCSTGRLECQMQELLDFLRRQCKQTLFHHLICRSINTITWFFSDHRTTTCIFRTSVKQRNLEGCGKYSRRVLQQQWKFGYATHVTKMTTIETGKMFYILYVQLSLSFPKYQSKRQQVFEVKAINALTLLGPCGLTATCDWAIIFRS